MGALAHHPVFHHWSVAFFGFSIVATDIRRWLTNSGANDLSKTLADHKTAIFSGVHSFGSNGFPPSVSMRAQLRAYGTNAGLADMNLCNRA